MMFPGVWIKFEEHRECERKKEGLQVLSGTVSILYGIQEMMDSTNGFELWGQIQCESPSAH